MEAASFVACKSSSLVWLHGVRFSFCLWGVGRFWGGVLSVLAELVQ